MLLANYKHYFMKLFKYMAMIIAAICMIGTFVSCEEEKEESADNNLFPKYFKTTVDSCARVGSVLIVDMTFTNKSGKDVQDLALSADTWQNLGLSRDDLNNDLRYSMRFSLNGGEYKEGLSNVSVLAGESVKLKIRVNRFDETNSARNVWLYVQANSNTLGMERYSGIALEKLRIADNRVLSNGVQTNDRKLSYTFVQAQRDANTNDVYLYFKLKNNTGKHLRNVAFRNDLGQHFRDDQGNAYYMEFGSNVNYMSEGYTTDIEAGAEVTFIVKARNVAPEANKFSGYFELVADNYVMEDDVLHFFNLGFAQSYN